MKPPKKWKMAIVIWLAIYPLITVFNLFFGQHLSPIKHLPVRTLVMTLLLAPIMVYIMIPTVQKILKNWLHR